MVIGPGNTTSPTSSAGAAIVATSSGAGAGAGFQPLERSSSCSAVIVIAMAKSLASAGWSSWLQIWCETALSRALFSPSWIGHSGARASGFSWILISFKERLPIVFVPHRFHVAFF